MRWMAALLVLVAPVVAQSVRVRMETQLGVIEIDVDAGRAPATAANFLKYADGGLYDGGAFHRTVKPDNQPASKVRIQVVQAGINPEKRGQELSPVGLERTSQTGLKHLDGVISMARSAPDSATADFFICIGDQPSLDFGGMRNPDGQGFAAFGRVVQGMEVVRRIQQAPAEGQTLKPPVRILSVRRERQVARLGQFEAAVDVGAVGLAGSAVFDAGSGLYRITGAGANIWGAVDAFQYAQRRVVGDVTATAEVGFPDKAGDPHKKGGLMLRASLDADSPHASVMVHADGLISLQYRREKGGPTAEVKSFLKGPARVRMARHGDVISYEVARPGGEWQPSGALTVVLPESLYLGLAVSSHNEKEQRVATFSGVTVQEDGVVAAKDRVVESTLEIVTVATGERRIVQRVLSHFEAPNWTADGSTLVYNGGGKIYRIPVTGGTPVLVPTGDVRCNNDHGLSPDGKTLVISGSVGRGQSQIYLVPMMGGVPKLITPLAPSYWHGWSPDGKTLAYCASRNGEYDIYTMPAEGGAETRLTTAAGLDDGPEYTPDGQYIYFNSDRSGLMRIWRMKANGEGQEMMSQGPETADWFAHISPDGKWMVYISYDSSVKGHPANKDVVLRLAPAGGGPAKTVVTLFGGQGTMNVPNWSPDGQSFAFVSYRLVKGAR